MIMQFFIRGEITNILTMLFFFLPHFTSLLFVPLLDRVFTGPGLQLQVLETTMIPTEETVTMFLNPYVRIPRGLMGQDVPSPHLV